MSQGISKKVVWGEKWERGEVMVEDAPAIDATWEGQLI